MKLENVILNKTSIIILSAVFTVLAATSVLAQEHNDLFKKEQTGKTGNMDRAQLSQKVLLVSIETRLVEMPKLAADELFKEQGGLARTFVINDKILGAISDMVGNKKAKVASQSKIVTKSGSNCKNKSVREFTYPTEYDVRINEETNSVQALPAGSGSAAKGVNAVPGMLIPTAFETRDCGTMLDVTPTIGPDNQVIDICCIFQRVRLSAYPNKVTVNALSGKTEVEQPVFLTEDVTTMFTMHNGTSALISVCDAISDQDKQDKASENIILCIMTTCVVPVN